MMKFGTFAGTVAIAVLLTACGSNSEKSVEAKNSPDGSRSFAATGFTGVDLAGSDDVVVKQGAAFSVVATGPQAVLDKLDISVQNGVLLVRRKSENFSWGDNKSATITVTLPALASAEVSGSGEMSVDRASGDKVDAVLSGSGNLEIALVEAKVVDIALAGSGDLSIKGGKADSGEISLAGSGDIDTTGMTLASADVSLAGSGDVNLTATTTADVAIIGSGDVRLGGGAKCDSSEMGSGTVKCS